MAFNPEIHHRHSIRLPNFDYSRPGYYFVTLCSRERECFFGSIENNDVVLNEMGKIVKKQWHALPGKFPEIELDHMVIMPNHLHGIIKISDYRRGGVIPPLGVFSPILVIPPHRGAVIAPKDGGKTLGQMIAWFKYESTKEINRVVTDNPEMKIWQRNFFDRIIRDDEELNRIRNYIVMNPETWEQDENNVRL